jgi:tetratricopeptide (TPR) repeat protein
MTDQTMTMIRRFGLASLAVVLLAGSEARAQTGTARGKVVDEKGQALEGVKVEIDFQGGVTRHFETKTNKKGEFTQVGLQPGVYKFVAQKEGYQGVSNEARVSLGDPTYLPDLKLTSVATATKAAIDDVQGPFTQALELSKQGKLDEAEAIYKEILAKNPTIPQVHYNLGWIHGQRKDWAGAEAAYKKALELKPDFSEASVALARVYQDSGQGEKAMALMTQAGEGDAKVQFSLGVMHLTANKNDEAEAAFKKAEAIDASNPEIQYHLATIALNKGKTEECVALLEKYLSMSPTNAQNVATAQGLLQALKPKK